MLPVPSVFPLLGALPQRCAFGRDALGLVLEVGVQSDRRWDLPRTPTFTFVRSESLSEPKAKNSGT